MAREKPSTFERLARGNRKSRKQLQRRLYADQPGLDVVHPNAGGIDIGNESHFVAVPPGRDATPVQEFGCWTAELVRMAEWLKSCKIDTVAMQSTGVYWFAVYDVLERHGLEVFLVNAAHTRNLPGRKSDVQESQWLMKLHTYGLLRNSFRPPEQIRRLRAVWRLRDQHVKDAGRHIQHMQKALTTMNVQLANAISDVTGKTGQAIVRAILTGERDPHKLAEFRDPHVRATRAQIECSLEGNWQEESLFELQQAVDSYDFTQKQIAECDVRLQQYLRALPSRPVPSSGTAGDRPVEAAGSEGETGKKTASRAGRKKARHTRNAPHFDLASELTRIYGVEITRVDGLDVMTVQTALAELGTDFRAWPSEQHFSSWLTLSPKREISGGKLIQHTHEGSRNRVAMALRIAATTLLRSNSYLGARYRHLRTRLGAPKAIKAMARHLACLLYRMVTMGQAFVDFGAQAFEQKREQREMAALERKAAHCGYRLVPVSAEAHP